MVRTVDPGVEVTGLVVRQSLAGLRERSADDERRGREIASAHGIEDPDPDGWYPLPAWLDAMSEIGKTLGDDALTQLGRKVPEGVRWPPNVDSASDGFATVNEAYQMNHRGGDIGYYEFRKTDERKQRVVCANPYACPFDKGIIEGTLQAFGYQFSYPPMAFIQETSDHCRAEGGERCEYHVTW
jgi:hypothetical protein